MLDNFSKDLNKLAEEGKLDPVIGRKKEILRILQFYPVERKITLLSLVNLEGKTAIVEDFNDS